MELLLFLGDQNDNRISSKLARILGDEVIASFGSSQLSFNNTGGRYILADAGTKINNVNCKRCVAVFKEGFKDSGITLDGAITAVLPSGNHCAANVLARCAVPALTCGFSSKDTLTLSSLGNENAVISLGRRIKTLAGLSIEPIEIPVALSGEYDGYTLLACAAVLLLTGNLERLSLIEL